MHIRHVIVRGHVQGVGYRFWTADTARQLGLSGFVRNHRDGSVEAILAGSPETVAVMLERMRQGPPSARVEAIEQREGDADLLGARYAGEDFSMLPTV